MDTLYERLYYYLEEHPNATNSEICDGLKATQGVVKAYVSRLKNKGLISVDYVDGKRNITILREFPQVQKMRNISYKQEVYIDMIEVFREDFKEVSSFDERLKIAREINIMLRDLK